MANETIFPSGLIAKDTIELPDGSLSVPALAFTSDPNTGVLTDATGYGGDSFLVSCGGTVFWGLAPNHPLGFAVNATQYAGYISNTLARIDAHGSPSDLAAIDFTGLDTAFTPTGYGTIQVNCLDHTAGSAESIMRFLIQDGSGSLSSVFSLYPDEVRVAVGFNVQTTTDDIDIDAAGIAVRSLENNIVLESYGTIAATTVQTSLRADHQNPGSGDSIILIEAVAISGTGEIRFTDTGNSGSTWSQGYITLSDSTTEWNTFDTNYGEVSLFNAMNQVATLATSTSFTSSSGSAGSDLVTNGSFATDTDWTKGTGWTIGAGVATKTAGTASDLEQDLSISADNLFRVQATINTTTAGSVRLEIGGAQSRNLGSITGTTTFRYYLNATTTGNLKVVADSSWAGTVDNVFTYLITKATAAITVESSGGAGDGFELRFPFHIGQDSGVSNQSSASGNVGLGAQALQGLYSGSDNVAIGSYTLRNAWNPARCIAIGSYAQEINSNADDNISIGNRSMQTHHTGDDNTAVGSGAMISSLTCAGNTSIGYYTLYDTTTGGANTAIGANAGGNVTTGGNNLCIGNGSGTTLTTGGNNIIIGTSTDASAAAATNEIIIGYNATGQGNNTCTMGNASTTTYNIYAASWTNISDARSKKDIKDCDLGLGFIMGLRPVQYKFKDFTESIRYLTARNKKTGKKVRKKVSDSKKITFKRPHYGFVAQEVKEVMDELAVDFGGFIDPKVNGGPDRLGLGYTEFIAPAVKAIQEQQVIIESLKKQVKALKADMNKLKKASSN